MYANFYQCHLNKVDVKPQSLYAILKRKKQSIVYLLKIYVSWKQNINRKRVEPVRITTEN